MKIPVAQLEALAKRAILAYGYSEAEATTILAVLMYAQLRGNNQGIAKLVPPGIPRDNTCDPITFERETAISARMNGGRHHAMVVVDKATKVAIKKGLAHGISVVGVNHLATSSGAIGYYAREIAQEHLIGLVFAGAMPAVAPHGSHEPVFGTNPVAVALPTLGAPVVLDMATASMPLYGVIEAKVAGRPLAPGIAVDRNGRPTIDPEAALQGALKTFDSGPKSSGLSLVVQALTGPLVGAAFAGLGDGKNNWAGHLLIALDPDIFTERDAFRTGMSGLVERIKTAKRLEGVGEILVPGEHGDRIASQARASGFVEIEENLYDQLAANAVTSG